MLPGYSEVAVTGIDNLGPFETSGVAFLNTDNGAHERSALLLGQILTGANQSSEFGKANNWGDIEAMCPAPDLEIGNYLWFDTVTPNGLQDPDENPAGGVTVELYRDPNGDGQLTAAEMVPANFVASDITGPDGQYLFTNADGVAYDTDYVVVIAASNYSGAGALVGFGETTANLGGTETRDSDGVAQPALVVGAAFSTRGPGAKRPPVRFWFIAVAAVGNLQVTKTVTGAVADTPAVTYDQRRLRQRCHPRCRHEPRERRKPDDHWDPGGYQLHGNGECDSGAGGWLRLADAGDHPGSAGGDHDLRSHGAVTVSNPLLGPGSIRVNKTVDGAAAPSPWQFTLAATTAGCDIAHVTPNPAATADGTGGFVVFNNLPVTNPGGTTCEYQVTETAQAGYSIDTGNTTPFPMTGITVTEGGISVVSVENDAAPGSVTVNKATNPGGSAQAFVFTLSPDPNANGCSVYR